uniref:Uncharacterized protein n=1 Tax=viral metagenome TaxID=1070528 RepID=A0A6H1ZW70_9ZZZZ
MAKQLIELLKLLKLFPESGHGEILIKIMNGEITICKLTENKKIN